MLQTFGPVGLASSKEGIEVLPVLVRSSDKRLVLKGPDEASVPEAPDGRVVRDIAPSCADLTAFYYLAWSEK